VESDKTAFARPPVLASDPNLKRVQESSVKKILFASFFLLVAISTSFAAPISNASLKGKYSFQLASARADWWNVSITCPIPGNNSNTLNFGGSATSNQSILGVLTFDAKGNVTGTATTYGRFDQTSTDATILPSCTPGAGNSGYAVYLPPFVNTVTGTYSVQSNGLGALVLTVSSGDTVNFILELAGTAAVRNSVFLTEYDPTTHRMELSGTAILQ
jgi:hypothetical protein